MQWLILKYLISAGAVVLISEVAKHSGKIGALIAALPVITLLSMVWMHLEHAPEAQIADQSWYTFWYVLPTLPMFLVFPYLLAKFSFWPSLGISIVLTVICFLALSRALTLFGIELI